METSKKLSRAVLMAWALMISVQTLAQQQPGRFSGKQTTVSKYKGTDSYRFAIYPGRNDSWGFDIYRNGRPVFHHHVLTWVTVEGKRVFARKAAVEQAAAVAVAKVEQGRSPLISEQEIALIARQAAAY